MATSMTKPPGLCGIGVGPREHRVVVVAGVYRIDGDEGHVAPVLAVARGATGRAASASPQGLAAEFVRDAMGMNGDEAHRLLARKRAEPLLDVRGRQAEPTAAADLDGDEVALLGASRWHRRGSRVRGRNSSCRS